MARLIPTEVPEQHPGDIEGWLDENEPFFDNIDSII